MQLVYPHRHSFTSHMFFVYLHALFVSEMDVVYSQALISFCSDTERFEFPHTHTVSVCISFMKCTNARAIDIQTRGSVCLVTKRNEPPQNLPQCYPISALFALVFSRRVAKSPCASLDKLVWFDGSQLHIPTHKPRNRTLDWLLDSVAPLNFLLAPTAKFMTELVIRDLNVQYGFTDVLFVCFL